MIRLVSHTNLKNAGIFFKAATRSLNVTDCIRLVGGRLSLNAYPN